MKQKVTFTISKRRWQKEAGNNLAVLGFALDSSIGFGVLEGSNGHIDCTQFAGFTGPHSFF